ncbi:hypothetical protein FBZ85_1416 [Azospirillum brasilense]|nr:hypothetical protein FBZ85_1416 [Azospirillum brasilense]
MTPYECVRAIVAGHRYRQSLPNPYRDDLDGLWMPGIINGPSGHDVILDSKLIEYINDLSYLLRSDGRSVDGDEWLDWVRDSVARALDASDPKFDLDVTSEIILNSVESSLSVRLSEIGGYEFAFGCTLFEGGAPPPFSIGPVRFETRLDWLERKLAEGVISGLTHRRVLCAWDGRMLRRRKISSDSRQEKAILSFSDDAPFICSVATKGMAREFGRRRARTTARLALTAIALLWQETSRALSKMNLVDDRVVRILHELTFQNGKIDSFGSRKFHAPGGQRLDADEWKILRSEFTDHFTVVGDILNSIVDIATPPRRPKTTHTLTHALMWFHQGCREDEQVIAVVNFAATLDCLAAGKGGKGIVKLIKAQIGIDADKELWVRGGQTAEQAVEEIYDHARNATMHGRKDDNNKQRPDSMPFHDWGPGRERAEALARHCLLACINWTAQHFGSDDPKSWMALQPD